MSLSTEQISEIKKFIHSRGFKHIEVEMEILDHVASAVEEKLVDNPKLSLSKAIHQVHASFGIMGFSVLEDELIKKIGKRVQKGLITEMTSFFTTRKLIVLVAVYALAIIIGIKLIPVFNPSDYNWFFYGLGGLVTLIGTLALGSFSKRWFKRSIVVANMANFHFMTFLIFGQGFGLVLKSMATEGHVISPFLFAGFFTFTVMFGVFTFRSITRTFNWTYECYLKYAD